MTVDQWDIQTNAKALMEAFLELHQLKMGATHAPKRERIMASTQGPRSPSGDGDNALDIEMKLLNETKDDTVPGGLFTMTRDALNYTKLRSIVLHKSGLRCTNHIVSAAMEIAENFPAAEELNELMQNQEQYIGKYIAREYDRIHGAPTITTIDEYLTAHSVQRALTSRKLACPEGTIRRWATEGKIRTIKRGNRTAYHLPDIIQALDQQ